MERFRSVLVCFLISGLIGCQSEHSVTITEYRPAAPVVVERKAPQSEVFRLVRWQPIAPLVPITPPTTRVLATSTTKQSKPARALKQMPVEIEQVYAARGSPIGFRRQDGQLIAIAGQTTAPLDEAHYEWKTVPGYSDQTRAFDISNITNPVIAVVGIALLGGLVFLIFHDNRHIFSQG